jgi:hypothetical protein
MNKDIRVLTTFPRHPKTIKLKRLLGTWEPIIVLWLWAAENRPNGDLGGLDIEDIAIAASWDDDPKTLINALLKVRFVHEVENGAYALHGWEEHNAYAANAEKRSNKARLAAQARWNKKLKGCSDNAKECSEHATSNAPIPNPSPTPNPSPNKLKQPAPPGQPSADPSKSKHFEKQVGSHFKKIKYHCEKIMRFKNRNGFNPFEMVQKFCNQKRHPGAIEYVMSALSSEKTFNSIEKPWPYANSIMGKQNGNFNERDAVAIHERLKSMTAGQLADFTCGIFDSIG